MNRFGLQAYRKVAVDANVAVADPHALVLMLYDGAIEAIRRATGHLAAGQVAEKGAALAKAARIVEEGLKAAVDRGAGGELTRRLLELYDYMTMRLLQANLRNDRQALAEVARLLAELRSAWAQIKPGPTATAAPLSAQPVRQLAAHA